MHTSSTPTVPRRPKQYVALIVGTHDTAASQYVGSRPANTALGRYPLLLPIVVTCKTEEDARLASMLNAELGDLEGKTPEEIWDIFCDCRPLETMLTHVPKFYAFRFGKYTGIWIGFEWNEVEGNSAGYGVGFHKRYPTFREAVLFMLKKGPLASKTIPDPSYMKAAHEQAQPQPETEGESEYEDAPMMESASTAGRRTVTFNPFPVTRTTSLPTPSASAATAPRSALRSARGAASVTARSSNCGLRSVSPIKRTALSTPKHSRAGSPTKPTSRAGGQVKVEDEGEYLPLFRDDSSPEDDPSSPEEDGNDGLSPDELARVLQAHLQLNYHQDFLRALLRPVPEQSSDSLGLPPLTLGARADRLVIRRGASDETFLTVLRIYAHARGEDEFARLMGRQLNWTVRDAQRLYRRIEMPKIFQ